MAKARRRRDRPEDSFVGLGGHSAYQEAPEVSLWGSRWLCIPSLNARKLEACWRVDSK